MNRTLVLLFAFLSPGLALSGQKILLVGDSHSVGDYGLHLEQHFLEDAENKVASYASCGSDPSHWVYGTATKCGFRSRTLSGAKSKSKTSPTPTIRTLLKNAKYDLLVVSLGANLLQKKNAPSWSHCDVERAVGVTKKFLTVVRKMAPDVSCVWAGSPNARVLDDGCAERIHTGIKAVAHLFQCHYVDLWSVVKYPDAGGDGLHFTREMKDEGGVFLSYKLADRVFDAACSKNPNKLEQDDSCWR